MPHRDYLDLPEGEYLRVHIPIQTDQSCLHSERDQVYHMRKGELWFLDATQPHAACSLSEIQRLTITLDFDRSVPFEKLFKDPKSYVENGKPCYISREDPDNKFLESIANLGNIVNQFNFAQIVAILAQAHFFKAVDCAQMYDWLIDVANRSNDLKLVEKTVQMKQYYLGS